MRYSFRLAPAIIFAKNVTKSAAVIVWAYVMKRTLPSLLIAEIKFRSPSAGPLSRALGPRERAEAYESAGAAMVSVLTDQKWFGGSLDDLSAARAGVAVPVLCKDYVIDVSQIERALRR